MMIGRPLVPRAVARSGRALLYHAERHGLQIVRPADSGKEIYDRGGHVGAIVTQLAGLVVPWKHVVIIVPALAESGEAHTQAVGGANGAAIKHYNIVAHVYLHAYTLRTFNNTHSSYGFMPYM